MECGGGSVDCGLSKLPIDCKQSRHSAHNLFCKTGWLANSHACSRLVDCVP